MDRIGCEYRAELHGSVLSGYAAVFDQVARVGGTYESVGRSAFDKVLGDKADVRCLVNHEPSRLLGRTSSGTLRLSVDDIGLRYEVDLPDTQDGRDLRTLVARGDLSGSSFGFVPGASARSHTVDGATLRSHTSVGMLLDVSPVTYPAYSGTDGLVSLRSLQLTPSQSARAQMLLARHRAHPERHVRG